MLNMFDSESINYKNFGFVFENFVLSILLVKIKDISTKVNYWSSLEVILCVLLQMGR